MSASREELIAKLLAQALHLQERGEPVNVRALCADHPELLDSVTGALAQSRLLPSLHRQATGLDGAVGNVLRDRYRLEERIGVGAMGVVYRAKDLELGRSVAVKVLRPELVAGARMDVRLAREGEVLAGIRHPGVVTIYDRGQAPDGRAFLVMELLRGCSVSQLLREADENNHELHPARKRAQAFQKTIGLEAQLDDNDVRQVVKWISAAAAGVQAAHDSGVVHRDIKPSNLFLERDGRLIVVDFGIVSTGSHATLGGDGSPLGTPAYMAPEQLHPDREPDVRTDIYGLGATLYHLLTGRPPYTGSVQQVLMAIARADPERADNIRKGLPVDLVAIIEKAMARAHGDRYPSAAAMREDLLAWLEYRPVIARRASLLTASWRRAKRSPHMRAIASVMLLVAIAATWLIVADWQAKQRDTREGQLVAQVPPSLLDALPAHRRGSSLRNNPGTTRLINELVDLGEQPGLALAMRVIYRSDCGDLDGAADDAARIAAAGNAPFAEIAVDRYRQGQLPDMLTQGDAPPPTGSPADRALVVVHAMRSRGPCPLWVSQLLEVDNGLDTWLGFRELRLLLEWRRAFQLGETDEGLAACEQLQQDIVQLETLRQRQSAIGCFVKANVLLTRSLLIESLATAEAGMQLAPDEFALPIVAGSVALLLEDEAIAERMFRRAIKLQPTSTHAQRQLATTLLKADRLDDAEALLATIASAGSTRDESGHAHLAGLLLYKRAWNAEVAGAAEADELWQQALAAFGKARQGTDIGTSFEEILCKDRLGHEHVCAELFQLLALRPLEAELLQKAAKVLPTTLDAQEVDALSHFLLRQSAHLGLRTR